MPGRNASFVRACSIASAYCVWRFNSRRRYRGVVDIELSCLFLVQHIYPAKLTIAG